MAGIKNISGRINSLCAFVGKLERSRREEERRSGGGENAAGEDEQHLLRLSKAFYQARVCVSFSQSGKRGGGAGGTTAPKTKAPPSAGLCLTISRGAAQRGSPRPWQERQHVADRDRHGEPSRAEQRGD